jgi:hypothetical protein
MEFKTEKIDELIELCDKGIAHHDECERQRSIRIDRLKKKRRLQILQEAKRSVQFRIRLTPWRWNRKYFRAYLITRHDALLSSRFNTFHCSETYYHTKKTSYVDLANHLTIVKKYGQVKSIELKSEDINTIIDIKRTLKEKINEYI